MRLISHELKTSGSLLLPCPLPESLKALVTAERWEEIDSELFKLTSPDGLIFKHLLEFHEFTRIEFTIAIRDSKNPHEEDGIWHDDGSRFMAASLSLTLQAPKQGGILEIKHRTLPIYQAYPTPDYGQMILFLTGEYGYIHKINKVEDGKRVIVALWCS